MRAILISLLGAIVSVLAFPPFGPGWLVLIGIAIYLWSLRLAVSRRQGLALGAVYGLVFFGGLMWWLVELELIALILVPVQAAYFAAYGWWLARYNDRSPEVWLGLAVGGWALMELVRYFLPVGGLEWGAAGYALSDSLFTRFPAATIGTSGLTVLVVLFAGLAVIAVTGVWSRRFLWPAGFLLAVLAVSGLVSLRVANRLDEPEPPAPERSVAIVQGSTPCPFEHCPPNERLRTYQQHLELTRTIAPGSVNLVVWSEGSTGSTNADPVLNPEVREAIGAEARRIGAWFLVGGDRILNDEDWINANVVFNPEGQIVGEYRKQHPVPFGEYVPLRPIFGAIPATDRVPRDMIRGEGPVVFDVGYQLGSVISFEGGISVYALEHRREGAEAIVVATNEGSYGMAPTADQFIGMTRMRAVELGVPVVHAAVTGKSTFVDPLGNVGSTTGLGTMEIITATLDDDVGTPFAVIGNLVMWIAGAGGALLWWRGRTLVGSVSQPFEEETAP